MKIKYIFIFLSILLICRIGLSRNVDEKDYRIIYNPAGWKLPDISLMKKMGTKLGLKTVICDMYAFQPYEETNDNKVILPFVLNKRNQVGNLLFNEELSNYKREWIEAIYVIRTIKNNSIIFYMQFYFEDSNNAEEIYDYISGDKYGGDIYVTGEPGKMRIGETGNIIFDRDNDGIFESLLLAANDSIEDNALLIIKIKEEYMNNKEYMLPDDLTNIKNAWIKYLDYPSQENMKSILPLLSSIECKKIDSPDKNQKRLWKEQIRNKLDWAEVDLDLGFIDSKADQAQSDFWGWICQSTHELGKRVFTSDRNAVKICFKLIPFGAEWHSGKVGRILDQFIRINPQMFLEELEEHYQYIRLEDVLDGNFGLELIGKADLKYLENEEKLTALKRVQDPKLMKLRDQCIDFLEKELKYLRDNFYLKELRKDK